MSIEQVALPQPEQWFTVHRKPEDSVILPEPYARVSGSFAVALDGTIEAIVAYPPSELTTAPEKPLARETPQTISCREVKWRRLDPRSPIVLFRIRDQAEGQARSCLG